jgi:hypothetical protein
MIMKVISLTNCEPFTKEEYLAAFDEYDTWKAEKEAAKAAS